MAFNANDRVRITSQHSEHRRHLGTVETPAADSADGFNKVRLDAVSYTHLRAHETGRNLVCRLLLEKKKKK